MTSNPASDYLAAEDAAEWPRPPLAENIAADADSRVSPLTSLIVLVLSSLGIWAAIWAAFASLGRG